MKIPFVSSIASRVQGWSVKAKLLGVFLTAWALLATVQIAIAGFLLSTGGTAVGTDLTTSTGWTVAAIIGTILFSAVQAAVATFILTVFYILYKLVLKPFFLAAQSAE